MPLNTFLLELRNQGLMLAMHVCSTVATRRVSAFVFPVGIAFCSIVSAGSHRCSAQDEDLIGERAFPAEVAAQQLVPAMRIVGNDAIPPAQAKILLFKQMRGLIQNELCVINDLCGLNEAQRQALVDLAESEWRVKSNASVGKRIQPHVFGTIDLDGLSERIVRDWLSKAGTPEQVAKYEEELADRMTYRKSAVISRLMEVLAEKLHLSSSQLEQVEAVLAEKWRDRWFRSLEATYDNVSLLPEIRPSWISSILSEAQRAALVSRDNTTFFSAHPSTPDSPSISFTERFSIGSTTSADWTTLYDDEKKPAAQKDVPGESDEPDLVPLDENPNP
jgi:hypothetical protein